MQFMRIRRPQYSSLGRLAICLLLVCGLFPACTASVPMSPLEQPAQLIEASKVRELVFQVSDQLDSEVLWQADLFADRVEALSGGALTVRVLETPPDLDMLSRGECDLAFLRNIQLAQAAPEFSTFSLPFLYSGQKHMSAVLNSDEVLRRLAGHLTDVGVIPLGSVYYGSTTLVSDRGPLRMPEDFSSRIIALRTNNTDKLLAFESIGARVLPYSQDSLAPLLGVEVEILPEDLRSPSDIVTIDTIEVSLSQALEILDDSRPLYVMEPGHSATALWLATHTTVWESLSPHEQAIIFEAQAGMVAAIDSFYSDKEKQATEALLEKGATLFSIEREIISNTIFTRPDKFRLPEYFDYKLYRLLMNYG